MESYSFKKSHRIRRPCEYKNVFRQGKKYNFSNFCAYALVNEHGPTRLGLVVSRKVGGAFLRNKYKRVLREFFRNHYADFPAHADIIVCLKPSASHIDVCMLRYQLDEFINTGFV